MNENTLHVIPIIDTVILPNTETKLAVDERLGDSLKHHLALEDEYALALTLKEGVIKSEVKADSFYYIGSLLRIKEIEKTSSGYLVYATSIQRIEAEEINIEDDVVYASYHAAEEVVDISEESQEEMLSYMKKITEEVSEHFKGSEEYIAVLLRQKSINQFIGHQLPFLSISLDKKYALIRHASLKDRGMLFIEYLRRQQEKVELQVEMAKKYSKKNNQSYREALLREQLKAIQKELGETDEDPSSPEKYRERIEAADLPDEVREAANREIRKLESAGNNNSEANIIRNYLDVLLDLPWKSEGQDIDIVEAKRVLEKHHFGMEKVKERIIEHLAVMKIQNEKQGSILLLVGPPGTGKTSLGKSIAESLGREYIRVSLGGVRDEAEIRGHRRTYIGALPGRIIQGMRKAGTKNPVFVLDEIDKLSASHNGDPGSAMLEVLDPEQNDTFVDHYLEVPYDLSDVLFIATANSLNTISQPLLDRMEVIEISSYTNNEKLHIAKDYLIKESLKQHGLKEDQLVFEEEAINDVINNYTREAGVRGLKKQIDQITRRVIEKIVTKEVDTTYVVKPEALEQLLGHKRAHHDERRKDSLPGVVTGLAWTPVGGEILFIEGTYMPGNGNMMLTGQLGDVMKESARIALSLVKSRLTNQMTLLDFNHNDIHIHVPSGATPKDGPSAGVTLLTALASLATGKKVDPETAMTGEVTLSGKVLPVGGIKEKVLAAHRAGIKKVILPKDNKEDVQDVPEDARETMTFIYVEAIEEVLQEALDIEIKKPEEVFEQEKPASNIGFSFD